LESYRKAVTFYVPGTDLAAAGSEVVVCYNLGNIITIIFRYHNFKVVFL